MTREQQTLALMVPPAYGTCTHWDQRDLQNRQLGVCTRMGATQWGEEIAISVTTNPEPVSDFAAICTLDTFGCRLHSDYVSMQLAGTL